MQSRPFQFTPAQKLWYFKEAWSKGLFRFEEFPSLLDECFRAPIEGAIYADILDALRARGAIVPSQVDHTALVHTFWELGSPVNTVTWYAQIVGSEIRVIDVDMDLELSPVQRVAHILGKGYPLGFHYLPHDAAQTERSGRTFSGEITSAGLRNVRVVPRTADAWIGINDLR